MSTNNDAKQDIRKQRTQKALSAAMMALLEKNSFNKITVNDLCNLAMVSRTSFYAHFDDKYHLLRYALRQTGDKIRQTAGPMDDPRPEIILEILLSHIIDNKRLFKNLLMEDVNHELLKMLDDIMINSIKERIRSFDEKGIHFETSSEIISVFLCGGMTKLLIWWIDSGFKYSKEEMAEYMSKILAHTNNVFEFRPHNLL